MQALLVGDGDKLLARKPPQVQRLCTATERLSRRRNQQEANVVVQMPWLIVPRRDRVDVQIEGNNTTAVQRELESLHPRFLPRLPQRRLVHRRRAVNVASELQPTTELAMTGKEKVAVIRGNDPGRGGDVARGATSQKAIFPFLDESTELVYPRALLGIDLPVAAKELQQLSSVHDPSKASGGSGLTNLLLHTQDSALLVHRHQQQQANDEHPDQRRERYPLAVTGTD